MNRDKSYITRSHQRCIEYRIDKNLKFSRRILNQNELNDRLIRSRKLILAAIPFMNMLYDFVKGYDFFLILTDEEGCILNIVGDQNILQEAFELKMVPGAFMSEEAIGTNAMGTALKEKRPVQVSKDEHFIYAYHKWTCSAAPIRDKDGTIIGCLDITGYSEKVHPHTLGMVVAAAYSIERVIENDSYLEEINRSKKYIERIFNSIEAGICACDDDGKVNYYNNKFKEMFNLKSNGVNLEDLIYGFDDIKNRLIKENEITDMDVYIKADVNKLSLNLSVYPLYTTSDHGYVYVFKDVKKERRLIDKISSSKAIYTFDKIIGQNERFKTTVEYAKKIADSKSTILILGESGTGKEVFAQSIHNYSSRSEKPFIAVNCAAIPSNLIESELFGYEEGAFTGAKKGGYEGKFQQANGGTIFLDEIGDMPLDMQVKLLRVIEEGVIVKIGGTAPKYVDVRIIAATNKDLKRLVEEGKFRSDLYYRLNVLPLYLMPLRERREDIPLLIKYFMDRLSKKLNKKPVIIDEAEMERLISYDWPGNIRELENYVEYIINIGHVPKSLNDKEIKDVNKFIPRTLSEVEKRHIENTLRHFNFNITQAAKALGIGRNTLYRKINELGINLTCVPK
ncbi:sigma-54-dependent Fis family transcriptional regulator [Thermobrachium celere]|uniref:sigma-54-dependent Fis family transcriptional regulator n=1 Tax=Thermobrachium celere TaxID=53422 RepID=UPI001A5D10F1|nr:sigma-54-dependent Fis family transcriptional regulator [Thermobrachium celere]GFR35373.1 sigma-54-dependent Fis family transcriptional regulator [Thermobrachium celere]